MVEIKKKRDFLREFIARFGTQTREEGWLLEYLVNSEYKLKDIVFVEELNPNFNGFKIYSAENKNGKFEYIYDGKSTADVSLLFSAIHNHKGVIYVQFDFEGKYKDELYLSLLEAPDDYYKQDKSNLTEKELEEVEELAETFIIRSHAGILRKKIDEALDIGDKELFMKLTDELNNYLKIHNIQ